MSKVIDELLSPWMVALHGRECLSYPAVRVATLAFCGSIPKKLTADLDTLPQGTASVEISFGYQDPDNSPQDKPEQSPVDELFLQNPDEFKQRIDIPRAYLRANHLRGGGLFKELADKELDCDMEMALDGDTVILELYHRYYRRYMIVRIS